MVACDWTCAYHLRSASSSYSVSTSPLHDHSSFLLLCLQCRQAGTTYRGDLRLDLCVSHLDDEEEVEDGEERHGSMQRLPLNLGRVPVMVKVSERAGYCVSEWVRE